MRLNENFVVEGHCLGRLARKNQQHLHRADMIHNKREKGRDGSQAKLMGDQQGTVLFLCEINLANCGSEDNEESCSGQYYT